MKKRKLSLPEASYRGRFAPSPTGPLHFGSLVAAVGSYVDAKHHHGIWLVRMEDLDTPRCVPGAASDILRTLEVFGLHSDEPVLYQSQRMEAYARALVKLQASGAAYQCCCTRKEIADSALHGIEGYVYPGTCRNAKSHPHFPPDGEGTRQNAWRVRTDLTPSSLPSFPIEFDDALQGRVSQNLEREIGDFVVKTRRWPVRLSIGGCSRRCIPGHHTYRARRRPVGLHATPDLSAAVVGVNYPGLYAFADCGERGRGEVEQADVGCACG